LTLETKMAIRVPLDWHRRVKAEAALRGMTVSRIVRVAVDEWLASHPREEEGHGKEAEARQR